MVSIFPGEPQMEKRFPYYLRFTIYDPLVLDFALLFHFQFHR